MIWKKTVIYVVLVAVLGMLVMFASTVYAEPQAFTHFDLSWDVYEDIPRSPQITLTVDLGEGETYHEEDPLLVYYEAAMGGYVNLIHYRTDGSVSILVRDQFLSRGEENEYEGTVHGPPGNEVLVALFTQDVVSDRNLEDFIRAPHRPGRVFRNYEVNRTYYRIAERVRPPAVTMFRLDFGNGSPVHNVTDLRYSGQMVRGYATSGLSTLEMDWRDGVEFTFDPQGFPEKAAIFVWVQGESRTRLDVILNNRRVDSLRPTSGTLEPGDEKKITVSSEDFIDGRNHMVLKVGDRHRDVLRLQRILIVF